MADQWSVRRGI
jgi:hypothetical protein